MPIPILEVMETIYHIETDMDCKVYTSETELCIAKANEDTIIRLLEGQQKLTFVSMEDPDVSYSIVRKVLEAGTENSIKVDLKVLLKEKELVQFKEKGINGLETFTDAANVVYSKYGAILIDGRNVNTKNYTIAEGVMIINERAFDARVSPPDVVDVPFYNSFYLTTIQLPESVIEIGRHAFENCFYLTSINIPGSVKVIAQRAFFRCYSLISIYIPGSVKVIEEEAFGDCESLQSVHISKSIEKIDQFIFSNCHSLSSIYIPKSVKEIGQFAFSECSSLTSIHLPDSVIKIDCFAFHKCSSLTSINIPKSLKKIEDRVFEDCESLTSINIPASVIEIGEEAFDACTKVYKSKN